MPIEISFYAYKRINHKTKTEIISSEALRAIRNPVAAKQLRVEIQNYHKTGYWNVEKLNMIFS
jgi:hypothetical protein